MRISAVLSYLALVGAIVCVSSTSQNQDNLDTSLIGKTNEPGVRKKVQVGNDQEKAQSVKEPKPTIWGSEQVRHKPGFTVTEDG